MSNMEEKQLKKTGELLGYSKAIWYLAEEMIAINPKWAFEDLATTIWGLFREAGIKDHGGIQLIRDGIKEKYEENEE